MADLPEGEAAPADGGLPDGRISGGFSAYVHIPFCQVRCGYCDFNTYTNLNMGPGASPADFPHSLEREIELSARVLTPGPAAGGTPGPAVGSRPGPAAGGTPGPAAGNRLLNTVFFGGGTPTMLRAGQLVSVLRTLEATFGLAPGAEVTTEANPETVTAQSLAELAEGGFTRVSFGMQSAVPEVLATLDRQHTPGQVQRAIQWARSAGLDVSLDLIYGAPGETMPQWQASLDEAIALQPDHISAYALTVEAGTKMGAQAARGQIRLPDGDEQALKYEAADAVLAAAGYQWYEISNWAKPGYECRHNAVYWGNGNWWGYGPGAHSHINGTRFWNVKHPLAYARRLADSASPAAAREVLSGQERRLEEVMLSIRMRQGIAVPREVQAHVVAQLVADGLVDGRQALAGRLVLTLRGRLLADSVTRELWV